MITRDMVLKYLKHVGLLAFYAAASVAIVTVVGDLGHFDVSTLPSQYQAIAVFIMPVLLTALDKLKADLDAQAASAAAEKQLAEAKAELVATKAMLKENK